MTFLQSFLLDGFFEVANITFVLSHIYSWCNLSEILDTLQIHISLPEWKHGWWDSCEEINLIRIWLSITACRICPQTVKFICSPRRLFNGYSLLIQSGQQCTSQFYNVKKKKKSTLSDKANDFVILRKETSLRWPEFFKRYQHIRMTKNYGAHKMLVTSVKSNFQVCMWQSVIKSILSLGKHTAIAATLVLAIGTKLGIHSLFSCCHYAGSHKNESTWKTIWLQWQVLVQCNTSQIKIFPPEN